MIRIGLLCVSALFAFAISSAGVSAAVLQESGGKLVGAQQVDVGGTLYDVQFVDGTCVAVFSGCDTGSDFAFTSEAAASAAVQSLLNQVLLDGSLGMFDSNPASVVGCGISVFCDISTPYSVAGTIVMAAYAHNTSSADTISIFGTFVDNDFTPRPLDAWARFTLSPQPSDTPEPSDIPEPGALILLGSALTAFSAIRRRRPCPSPMAPLRYTAAVDRHTGND